MGSQDTKRSSSGLQFQLHPLVLVNVSDHFVRSRANTQNPTIDNCKALGLLLGQQNGRVVDISNSFELKYQRDSEGAIQIDEAFLTKRQEQYKQTFAKLDVVGWYSTGQGLTQQDMVLHQKMVVLNESPVFMLLDPVVQQARHKDLPVLLFESELHVVEGQQNELVFVQASYTIETSEAERIGVNHVTKVLPAGNDKGADQLTAHYTTLHSAIKVLSDQIAALQGILNAMQQGHLPYDHQLVRQASSLIRRLPAVKAPDFSTDYMTEYNDAMLTVYLSSITKGTQSALDLIDKYTVAYDRSTSHRRRGPAFEPGFMHG